MDKAAAPSHKPAADDWPGPSARTLTAVAVGVGLLLRCVHYFARPSFWGDEGFLLLNLRTYGLGRLLAGRLDAVETVLGDARATQAGPLGFLALLKGLMPAAGPAGELAMRLLPFLFSCAGLIVFALLARRILPRLAWAAVLVFACHEELLHQAANTKHYAIDVFAAVILGAVALSPAAKPLVARAKPWALLLLTLVLLMLCYAPAIVAPVALVAAWAHDQGSRGRSTAAYIGCFLAFAAAALAVKHFNVDVQQDAYLASYWAEAFPNWRKPASVPLWLVGNTVELWNYAAPGLIVGFALVVAQLLLVPARRWDSVTLLLVGTGMATLAAAMLGLFPYQGRRVDLFLVPLLLLASLRAANDLSLLLAARRPEVAPFRRLPLLALAVPGALGVVAGLRASTVGLHDNGRFRQVTSELLAARPPGGQVLFAGAGPASLASAYAFDGAPDTFTAVTASRLDPARPVVVVFGQRVKPAERDRLLASSDYAAGRTVQRTADAEAGNMVYLSARN